MHWRLSCERGRWAWEWNWARCFQLVWLWLLVRSKCCSVTEPVSVMQFCFSSKNSIRCIYMSPWMKAPEPGRDVPATSCTVKWLQFCFWTWNDILILYQCRVLIPYESWYLFRDKDLALKNSFNSYFIKPMPAYFCSPLCFSCHTSLRWKQFICFSCQDMSIWQWK